MCQNHKEEVVIMYGIIPLHVIWLLVHPRAVTDPTTEHHCEDHLEDLQEKKSVIQ